MTRLPLSAAASALLRLLLQRCGASRDRILLTEFRSTDWQSLTFVGERHEIRLRIAGPDSHGAAVALLDGLEDQEFDLNGHIVADIKAVGKELWAEDGSVEVRLEALTLASD